MKVLKGTHLKEIEVRSFVAAAITTLLVACGGGGGSDTPPDGWIVFTLDTATCPNVPIPLSFFIDGANVGLETLTVGTPSKTYSAKPGGHVISAKITTVNYSWPSRDITVPAGNSYTAVLICT